MSDRFHTTVTERGSFRTCRRNWYLDNVLRLTPRNQVTWYLIYGDVMHAALEAYYRPKTSKSKKPPRDLSLALDAFGEAWAIENKKLSAMYGPLFSMGIEEEWYDYFGKGRETLTYYDQFDKEQPLFKTVVDIAIEERAYVDILTSDGERMPGLPLLSGKIDLVVENDRGIWIVDHKNLASKASEGALDVDDQLTGYCYIWYRLTGTPPDGAYYNVLVKDPPKSPKVLVSGQLSKDKDQRTTYSLYLEALNDLGLDKAPYSEFLDFLQAKGWGQFFQRIGPVTRNLEELDSFQRYLAAEYADMTQALTDEVFRYPNAGPYTCPSCKMLSICRIAAEQGDVDWVIENGYDRQEARHEIPESILSSQWEGV